MRKSILLFLILLFLVPLLPAQAQDDHLIIVDEYGSVDEVAVREAAQPLLDQGATVALYFVREGRTDEFEARLRADGLLQDDELAPSVIAIFIAGETWYSDVLYGRDWSGMNNAVEMVRGVMVGSDADEAFTQPFVDTLTAINDAATAPRNAPTLYTFERSTPEPHHPTITIPTGRGHKRHIPTDPIYIMVLVILFAGVVAFFVFYLPYRGTDETFFSNLRSRGKRKSSDTKHTHSSSTDKDDYFF